MAQKKAHEVDGWLARRDPAFPVVLIYGPDHGMVSERAARLASLSGVDLNDPFSVSRLDAAELDRQPGRLVDEVGTIPMFAERRLVWVRGAGAQKSLADDLKAIVERPSAQTLLVIEAGELRKTAPLRTVVEGSPTAMALPCYVDEKRGITQLIGEELREFSVDQDAADLLVASLGGDRLVIRSELRKLATYSAGSRRIDRAMVEAVVADVPVTSIDAVVDAVLAGRAEDFERAFGKVAATGQAQSALLAVVRIVLALHLARGVMAARRGPASVGLATMRPPPFGPRRALVEVALGRFSEQQLAAHLRRLHDAVLESRRNAELAEAIARQAMLALVHGGGRQVAA